MIICNNETSKICPDWDPTSPSQQEVNPQNYRLSKINEVEAYFLDEIFKREKLAKKMKRFATNSHAVGTGLITTVVINSSLPIFAFGQIKPLIKPLPQVRLGSISDVTSQAIQDKNIWPSQNIAKISQEVSQNFARDGKILQAKRRDSKTKQSKGKTIYKKTVRRIALTRKKRGQSRFFAKNRKYFRYPGCQYR